MYNNAYYKCNILIPAPITRILLFLKSHTKTFPFVSTATPLGALNMAAEEVPSTNPATLLPASVATNPEP